LDQVAIVTGAGGSIGGAIARQLADDGYDILVVDLRQAAADRTAAHVRDLGRSTAVAVADVRRHADAERVVQQAADRWGRVDVLVNAAGGHITLGAPGAPGGPSAPADQPLPRLPRQLFHETAPANWTVELDVNLVGTLNFSHAAIPRMLAQRSGVIVNLSSGHALKPAPTMAIYAAAKAGIIAFSRAIAAELGPSGIRVNCVAPGWTVTEWEGLTEDQIHGIAATVPLQRMPVPEDIANAVAFLVSPRGSCITGACLSVSGGHTMH
jgi:NAD(P)-dependent dehydrogenase (short-subunit alcohol dehydrogenase family)